jgi:cell division protease FtsH
MAPQIRTLVFWVVIAISAVLLWEIIKTGNHSEQVASAISYSQFLSQVDAGNVASVLITGNRIEGKYRDNSSFAVNGPTNQDVMIQTLRQKNVDVRFTKNSSASESLLATWAPLIVIAILWLMMIRQIKLKRRSAQQADSTQNPISQNENRWSK